MSWPEFLTLLNETCKNVIEQCVGKSGSILELCKNFCRKWIPDPQNFLSNDGVISNFYELNQFLLSEVFAWSQCELFASINADVTDADSPFLTCLALFLSLAAAMRCDGDGSNGGSAGVGDNFSQTFSSVQFEEDSHKTMFNFFLLDICHCDSTQQFTDSVFFKSVILGEYDESEKHEEPQEGLNGVTSSVGLANETIGSLNISKLDLNKSVSYQQKGTPTSGTPQMAAKRFNRLLSRLSSGGGGGDGERSFLSANNSCAAAADKSFYGDSDSPFVTSSGVGVGDFSSSVPPLRNPKLSVSSPYSKLAQMNATTAKKFHLLTMENDDLKIEAVSKKKQIESLGQIIEASKEQMSVQSRKLMDLNDENEASRANLLNTEKQLATALGKMEELETSNRSLESERQILALEVQQTNKKLALLEKEKTLWAKQERQLHAQLKEEAEYAECQQRDWAQREELAQSKIKELKQAHDFLATRRTELQTEVNQLKEDKLEIEANWNSKYTKETCALGQELEKCREELEQLKSTNEEQNRSLANQNEELRHLRIEKSKLESENGRLEKKCESASESLVSQTGCLQQQVQELSRLRSSAEQHCQQLSSQLQLLQGELKLSLETNQEKVKEEVQRGEKKLLQVRSEMSQEVERLKAECSAYAQTITQMDLKEKLNLTEINELQVKLNKANEERNGYVIKLSELENEKRDRDKTICQLQQNLADLQKSSEEKMATKDKLIAIEKQNWGEEKEQLESELEKKSQLVVQANEKVVALRREWSEAQTQLQQTHETEMASLRQQLSLAQDNSSSMAAKLDLLQLEVARLKGDQTLVHKEVLERLEQEVASLRSKANSQNQVISDRESQLALLRNEIVQLTESLVANEKRVEQLKTRLSESSANYETQLQSTNQKSAQLTEQLNFQINLLTEEKDIMQSSLEMENKNLTDSVLLLETEKRALTEEKEALSEEKEALRTEVDSLADQCRQWQLSYQSLQHQHSTTEELCGDLKLQLETSEEQLASVQREKLRVEESAKQLRKDNDCLADSLAQVQESLKYADETTQSFKRLYKREKDKNLKLAEGHTFTTQQQQQQQQQHQRKLSLNIKQEAANEERREPEATKVDPVVVTSYKHSSGGLDARKATSASDLKYSVKSGSWDCGKPPLAPSSLRNSQVLGGQSSGSNNYAAAAAADKKEAGFNMRTLCSESEMANKRELFDSQDQVHRSYLAKLSEDVAQLPPTRSRGGVGVNNLNNLSLRRRPLVARSGAAEEGGGSVSSMEDSCSAASSLGSCESVSDGTFTPQHAWSFSNSAPQLPGSVVVHTATNSSSSSNLSRRVPLGTTTSSSSMTSSLSSHPMASAGAVEEDGRWSEIERRNSMYPKHLQSSYPTEEIVHNNTQVVKESSNNVSRKRRSKSPARCDVITDNKQHQQQVTTTSTSALALGTGGEPGKQTPRKSTTTARRLSASLMSLSASKRARKENLAPPTTSSSSSGSGVMGSLSLPSPQKLFQKVARGRRSNLVEPLSVVPESTGGDMGRGSGRSKPVVMEFPNTPPATKKPKRKPPSSHLAAK